VTLYELAGGLDVIFFKKKNRAVFQPITISNLDPERPTWKLKKNVGMKQTIGHDQKCFQRRKSFLERLFRIHRRRWILLKFLRECLFLRRTVESKLKIRKVWKCGDHQIIATAGYRGRNRQYHWMGHLRIPRGNSV
jgi:hypothetical protein